MRTNLVADRSFHPIVDAPRQAPALPIPREERLRRYLNAYWLRPENAIWMTLRSEALSEASLDHPSADFCCGDGIFSFIHARGMLDPSFDVFCGTNDRNTFNANSIALPAAQRDMFDCISDAYDPIVIARPNALIDVGMDLKESLLEKAHRLQFYKQTLHHDCNKPLPFEDESLQSIYCNSAYWVRGIDGFLREIARVLRPVGRAVLHVKLDAMRECNLSPFRSVLGDRFLEIVTGDRLDNWVTLTDQATWERRFERAELNIESKRALATATHARLWDVGLRPLAPMLIRLANSASAEVRNEVKRDWVELMHELVLPLCDPQLSLGAGVSEPVEMQFVLSHP